MEKMGKILFERYELGRLLGQGNFAKVYYAKKISDGRTVAIKVIDKEKISKVGLDVQIKREITAMKLLRHPNILQVHEVMASKGNIYIVLEYAKGGELFAKVARGRLREDTVRRVFQQLISAVESCHGRGVFHRDLKLENMLLDESGNLKVSDFGLTALVDSARQDCSLQTICGTPAYVAPEVISRKGYDGAKSDIWSCGVILFAMLAGYLPFRDSNLMEMYKKIRKAEYRCPNWFPPEVRKLLAKILDPNPRTRISIAKIMDNPWFRKGLGTRTVKHEEVVETGQEQQDGSGISSIHNEVDRVSGRTTQEIKGLQNMNAFDIISLSSGFDLSGLFVEDEQREDVRFTSQQSASVIIAKLEEIAGMFSLKVLKKDGGFFRLSSGSGEGGGRVDTMLDVEIFEFAPSFHLVEMKKSGGDSFEYQKMLRQKIKPALQDVVWAWHGDQICNLCEPLEA